MRIVLLGPPGAGKGTQCKKIADRYKLVHLSSGDILRQQRANGTDLGKKAQNYMNSGELVPDSIIVEMMAKAVSKTSESGFVLDGFPRTVNQAVELDKSLKKDDQKINVILNLKVDDSVIVKRITGRRSCPDCGDVYHVQNLRPKVDGICDKCGGRLVQRSDDTEQVVLNRLKNYYQQTAPVVDYYRKNNIVYDIDANKNADEVLAMIFDILDSLVKCVELEKSKKNCS